MKRRTKISVAESRNSSSFFVNKSGVQIGIWVLFGQKVKGGIWFPKIDSQKNTPIKIAVEMHLEAPINLLTLYWS